MKTVERIHRGWIDIFARRPRAACGRPWRSKIIFSLVYAATAALVGLTALTQPLRGKVSRRTSIKLLRATGHRWCGCTAHPAAQGMISSSCALFCAGHSSRWCMKSLFMGDVPRSITRELHDCSNIVSWNLSIFRLPGVKGGINNDTVCI